MTKRKADLKSAAKKLYWDGKKPKAIAEKLGIDPKTVSNWVSKYKWVAKSKQIEAKKEQILEQKIVSNYESLISDVWDISKAKLEAVKGHGTPLLAISIEFLNPILKDTCKHVDKIVEMHVAKQLNFTGESTKELPDPTGIDPSEAMQAIKKVIGK